MDELIGRQLGLYEIVSQLGTGGMANVYKAYQSSVDRYVAIKVLTRQHTKEYEIFTSRFMQEAQVVAKLEHPHILPVYDFGETEDYLYLVMRLVNAGTLWDRFHGQPFPLEHIRHIIVQVGDALDYAHTKGIVHRDIKPKNILMDDRDNCLLTDFGIAKVMQADLSLTQMGTTLGTPTYMSPEQIQGESLDGRSDIYALGVILFQLATGHLPFEADTPHEISTKHLYAELPSARALNPELPAGVEAVIAKAMAKNPDARYATAGEMVQAMKDLKLEKPAPEMMVDRLNGKDNDDDDQTTVLPSLDSDQFASQSLAPVGQVEETMQLNDLQFDESSQPTPIVPDSQPAIPVQVVPDSQPSVPALEPPQAPINVHNPREATPPPFPVAIDTPSQSFWNNRGVWIVGAIGVLIIILLGVLIGLNLSRTDLPATDVASTEQPLNWTHVLTDTFSSRRLEVADENGVKRIYSKNQYLISVEPGQLEDDASNMVRSITFVDDRVYEDFLLEVELLVEPPEVKPLKDQLTEKNDKLAEHNEKAEVNAYGVTFRNQGRNFYTLEITREGSLKLFKVSAEEELNFAIAQAESVKVDKPIHLKLEAIGPKFKVTVNEEEIGTYNDPAGEDYLKQGDIGFVVHPAENQFAYATFDNLKISVWNNQQ
ncbi:MAG: protein kinase [Anaerolineae bacterium]|nr:protein kinase [Anaerolineae bacterium]